MAEGMYPKCGKCGDGTLLPFFNEKGENFYKCTKCVYNFTRDGYE
jgi:ribosomal protein S27AE